MNGPAITPGREVRGVEHLIETQAIRDAEIAEQRVRRTLEDHVALVDDRDPVELVELPEIMNDADETLMVRLGEAAQQREDLVLGLRIEARRNLVADHAGRIEGEFQAERKTAQLPPGKG